MKSLLLLILVYVSFLALGQERETITYSYGRAKIPNDQQKGLTQFLKRYQNVALDSIIFEGSSDSAGIFWSNFRMTEWRARKLRNYSSDLLKNPVRYRILPTVNKGEGELRNIRSVNIVVYPSKIADKKKKADEELALVSGCYKVAYTALQSCNVRYEKKGSRSYVYLEKYFPMSAMDEDRYYYGTENNDGNFEAKELKWRMTQTGESHWKGERLVAKIQEKDFDRYKIFTIDPEPCTTCHDDFAATKQISDNVEVNKPDYVLMKNLQYRQPWILKKQVVVRIPKEFVDPDMAYVSNRTEVKWTEKKKGKSPAYYFAKVSQSDGKVDLIYRPYRMPVDENCALDNPYTFVQPELQFGTNKARSEVINFVEFGMHNQNSTNYSYAAIGAFAGSSAVELEFLAGIHQKGAFFGAIRARYNVLTAPFSAFKFSNNWQHSLAKNRFWYSRIYIGAEYKGSLGKRSDNYLEPNLNIGLSIAQNGNPTFQRFFVQYGRGLNFILESPRTSYSIFQFGFQAHLGKKEYLREKGTL